MANKCLNKAETTEQTNNFKSDLWPSTVLEWEIDSFRKFCLYVKKYGMACIHIAWKLFLSTEQAITK